MACPLTCPRRFPPNDRELHMFDFDPDQEEIDLANNDILEMVPKLTRNKFNHPMMI
jgi:hypothetical protein